MNTVLMIEGDTDLHCNLQAMLRWDCTVVFAASGEEAIIYLQHNVVDVVLLDLLLPDCDVFDVLAQIIALTPRPGIIVHSAVSEIAKVVKAMKLGVDEYIVKPCDLKTLRTVILRMQAKTRLGDSSLAPGQHQEQFHCSGENSVRQPLAGSPPRRHSSQRTALFGYEGGSSHDPRDDRPHR